MGGHAHTSFCVHGEEKYRRWPAELTLAAQGLSCMEFDYSNLCRLLDIIVLFVILIVFSSFIFFFICNDCL